MVTPVILVELPVGPDRGWYRAESLCARDGTCRRVRPPLDSGDWPPGVAAARPWPRSMPMCPADGREARARARMAVDLASWPVPSTSRPSPSTSPGRRSSWGGGAPSSTCTSACTGGCSPGGTSNPARARGTRRSARVAGGDRPGRSPIPPAGPASSTWTCTTPPTGHTHLDLRYLLLAPDRDPVPPPGESPEARWFGWDEATALADEALVGALRAARLQPEVRRRPVPGVDDPRTVDGDQPRHHGRRDGTVPTRHDGQEMTTGEGAPEPDPGDAALRASGSAARRPGSRHRRSTSSVTAGPTLPERAELADVDRRAGRARRTDQGAAPAARRARRPPGRARAADRRVTDPARDASRSDCSADRWSRRVSSRR